MTTAAARAPQEVVEKFFQFSLLGMLASGYFAVLGSGYMDWPTAILTFAALCLRALMVAGVVRFEIPGRIVAALTLLYIGFYPLDYFYISGGFLPAAPHLIFFLGSVKILTARTRRDFMFVKTIAVMALLAAAVLSVSLAFFAFLTVFLLFSIATLSSGEVVRSTGLFLSEGEARRTLSRSGLRAFPRRLGMLSFGLFGGILLLTAGMFFVLPRTARAAFQRFAPERYHLPGFSNEVTLGEIGGHARLLAGRWFPGRPLARHGALALRWETLVQSTRGRRAPSPRRPARVAEYRTREAPRPQDRV
jgi:hypothetical protein